MAFNPNGYQTLYGFSMLDELHNFFPEVLYDDQIFPQESWMWMRHRVRTLFPHVFVRQQNMYSIYNATDRRTNFTSFVNTLPRPAAPLVQTPVNIPLGPTRPHIVAAPHLATPPHVTRTTTTVSPMAARRRARVSEDRETTREIASLGLSAIFLDSLLNTNTNNLMFNFIPQTDVPVVPTAEEVAAGAREVPSSEVPEDTTCAVCQEHGSADDAWRRLYCSHHFHSRCILPWFEQNVHCPVCRADIREVPTSDRTAASS